MRKLIIILMAGFGGVIVAQTNQMAPASSLTTTNALSKATNGAALTTNAAPAKVPTEISSDMADFDLNARLAVYSGHVVVLDPQVKMTCGQLVIKLPEAGQHLSHVVAETNVVIDFTDAKGQKYHVTSAKAVYDYKVEGSVTNETVTFTGSPKVETAQSTIESEPMIWDRTHNKFKFVSPKMISHEGLEKLSNTNNPAMKLF